LRHKQKAKKLRDDRVAEDTMDSLDACMLAAWLWKFQ